MDVASTGELSMLGCGGQDPLPGKLPIMKGCAS